MPTNHDPTEREERTEQRASDREERAEQRQHVDETVGKINGTVQKVDTAAERLARSVRIVLFASFVLIFLSAAQQLQTTRLLRSTDHVDKNVEALSDEFAEIRRLLEDVQQTAQEVDEQTPEEQRVNQAVANAVLVLIPQMSAVLCDQYPESCAENAP
jgi:ABC-type transporter Mla subunit MlaD